MLNWPMPLEDLICCDNGNGNSSKQITVYMIIIEDVPLLLMTSSQPPPDGPPQKRKKAVKKESLPPLVLIEKVTDLPMDVPYFTALYSTTSVANKLDIHQSSVSQAVERGQRLSSEKQLLLDVERNA